MIKKIVILPLFFCFLRGSLIQAKDFGRQGESFYIEEDSFSDFMQKRLQSVSEKKLKATQKEMQKRVVESAQNPRPVQGLKETFKYSSKSFDPSIVAKETLTDEKGKVIVKKGTKVNPLDVISLDTGLLFFDGTNLKHIKWASSQKGAFKWILVKGKPIDLEEKEGREVFFDQHGMYCKKFDLKKIPCRITQDGRFLRIEEIPVGADR